MLIRLFSLSIVVLLLSCGGLTFAQQEHRAIAKERLDWKEDLQFLAKELPERHRSLFFEMSEQDFRNEVAKIESRIASSSKQQMQLELCRLLTSIGDGHTRVNIDYQDFQFIPVHFQQFSDGLFIKDAVDQFDEVVGGKLLAINDSDVQTIYKEMATVIAHDNTSYLGHVVPFYMSMVTMLDFVGVTEADKPVRLTFEKDGARRTVQVTRLSQKEMNEQQWTSAKKKTAMFEEQESKPYWTKWLPESKTLYMKYRRCRGFLGFAALSTQTMEFIKNNDVDRLVIDMRLNGGGNSAVMEPLLMALRGSKLDQKERLYVVTGRKTFSSAVLNSIHFKQKTNATLIGLPTGGKPNHYGEVKNMSLPNSGLVVTYSTNYFEHYKGGDPESLDPDVSIEPTFQQWCNGEDAVMEYILKQPVPKSASSAKRETQKK